MVENLIHAPFRWSSNEASESQNKFSRAAGMTTSERIRCLTIGRRHLRRVVYLVLFPVTLTWKAADQIATRVRWCPSRMHAQPSNHRKIVFAGVQSMVYRRARQLQIAQIRPTCLRLTLQASIEVSKVGDSTLSLRFLILQLHRFLRGRVSNKNSTTCDSGAD